MIALQRVRGLIILRNINRDKQASIENASLKKIAPEEEMRE